MLLMGAYLIHLGITTFIRKTDPLASAVIFVVIGTVFFLIGMLLTLFREGVTVDRVAGTVSQWRKIFRNKIVAVHRLNEFGSIELHTRRSAKRTGHIVELVGNSKRLVLCDEPKLEAAKECANDASAFLSLPITDKTMV